MPNREESPKPLPDPKGSLALLREFVTQGTRKVEIRIHVDPDRSGTNFVCLRIQAHNQSFEAFSARYFRYIAPDDQREAACAEVPRTCQANNVCDAMLELAQLWSNAELCPDTLRVRLGNASRTPRRLCELALAAWYEAFARPFPPLAERKAGQKVERQRMVDLLRGGPRGIEQWNAIRNEALTRAGHFRRVNLAQCDLRGANLSYHIGSWFGGVDLQGANFEGVNLTGGELRGCFLMKCCFRNAVLDGVSCRNADLRHADFEGASLQGCDFSFADCRDTHFKNANLRKVVFSSADLRGADLSTAELEGARFGTTKHDATTRFPVGFEFPVKRAVGQVGDRVRVTSGIWADMEGEVKEILEATCKVCVELTIFGRQMPVELDHEAVEPL